MYIYIWTFVYDIDYHVCFLGDRIDAKRKIIQSGGWLPPWAFVLTDWWPHRCPIITYSIHRIGYCLVRWDFDFHASFSFPPDMSPPHLYAPPLRTRNQMHKHNYSRLGNFDCWPPCPWDKHVTWPQVCPLPVKTVINIVCHLSVHKKLFIYNTQRTCKGMIYLPLLH